MMEEIQSCPLCRGRKFDQFDRRVFRGFEVENQLCTSCGLVFQSPRMTDTELDDFYSGKYRTVYQGQEEPDAKDLSVQRLRAAWLVNFFRQHTDKPSRYLDIGSSSGMLIDAFQNAFNCTVRGVEPGDSYRQYAQDRGLTTFESLHELKNGEEGCFDLISLIHVLEHIHDPLSYLEMLRENHLTDDGQLLIEVPNLYAHDSFELAHLYSFSAHTLREILRQGGFEVIKIRTHGHPRSLMLNLYITVLAQPIQGLSVNRVNPEKWVRLKRKWGMFKRRIIQRVFPDRAWIPIQEIIGD